MTTSFHVISSCLLLGLTIFSIFLDDCVAHEWKRAHATFYEGGPSTFERRRFYNSTGGACSFSNTEKMGYGTNTVALSSVLFKDGCSCGACFEIRCVDEPKWCLPGNPSIVVTATDHCDAGGWCNPPREHFDFAWPAFFRIVKPGTGIIPVEYRRVPCLKQGGIRFTFGGNPWFIQVVITNVADAGDVTAVEVKVEGTEAWTRMDRDWGETWKTGNHELCGKCLTFKVTTSDGRCVTAVNAAPIGWQFGQTYESRINF
ncbi:EXPA9 [Linum perenne]